MKPLLTCDKSSAKFIAEVLGLEVKSAKMYQKGKPEQMTCQACGKMMTTKNIGAFVKGKSKAIKVELYCDNPFCVKSWLEIRDARELKKRKKVT